MIAPPCLSFLFFFNDTATTEIYTLSLHDALPISPDKNRFTVSRTSETGVLWRCFRSQKKETPGDRKSTRLNSSHQIISYAVFCLKKKKTNIEIPWPRRKRTAG